MNKVELAVKGRESDWEFIGDYPTIEAAQAAARDYAEEARNLANPAISQYNVDDHGVMVFGISEDPGSGHYETTYSVEVETGEAWAV